MDERKLIESEKMNTKNFFLAWWAIAMAMALTVVVVLTVISFNNDPYYWYFLRPSTAWIDYAFLVCLIGLGLTIPAIIFYFVYKKVELVVTDKRVYGSAACGKRVDLPMDSISAIGTSVFKGISISTSSGIIKFAFIKNRDEIRKILSEQLIARQNGGKVKVESSSTKISNIEELKQYKELLDTGVITSEEFERKKEELLK